MSLPNSRPSDSGEYLSGLSFEFVGNRLAGPIGATVTDLLGGSTFGSLHPSRTVWPTSTSTTRSGSNNLPPTFNAVQAIGILIEGETARYTTTPTLVIPCAFNSVPTAVFGLLVVLTENQVLIGARIHDGGNGGHDYDGDCGPTAAEVTVNSRGFR